MVPFKLQNILFATPNTPNTDQTFAVSMLRSPAKYTVIGYLCDHVSGIVTRDIHLRYLKHRSNYLLDVKLRESYYE